MTFGHFIYWILRGVSIGNVRNVCKFTKIFFAIPINSYSLIYFFLFVIPEPDIHTLGTFHRPYPINLFLFIFEWILKVQIYVTQNLIGTTY